MHLFYAVATSDSLESQIPRSEFKLDINSNGKKCDLLKRHGGASIQFHYIRHKI